MNYEKTLEYIHSFNKVFCKPGLERTKELLTALDNPEKQLKCIHVGGTNGKGSTSSMLSEILICAGYKVGLYTSPYVKRFNERMRINGIEISDSELALLTSLVQNAVEKMVDKPTEFELITAVAFEYFKHNECDVVVLEVGLGGRLDSTNVIDTPLLSIITGISLDHVNFLGDTVEKIAYEKAGIIKENCPVLFGGENQAALDVICQVAKEKNAAMHVVNYNELIVQSFDLNGSTFSYNEWLNMHISLLGSYQPKNASLVLSAVDILRKRGLTISNEAVRGGLEAAKWPARFEILRNDPIVIFDGAHNAEGIEAAVKSIKQYFGNKKVVVMTGVLSDKDYEKIAKDISSVAKTVFTITPDNPRALDKVIYSHLFSSHGIESVPCENIETAIEYGLKVALDNDTALCCLGSLYTYASVSEIVQRTKKG